MKINPHLTDVVSHHLDPQVAATKVAGHEAGEARRHNVGDVVGDCGVAVGHKNAAHSESHGTFTSGLTILLTALVGIQTVSHPAAIIGQAISIHGHRKQVDH